MFATVKRLGQVPLGRLCLVLAGMMFASAHAEVARAIEAAPHGTETAPVDAGPDASGHGDHEEIIGHNGLQKVDPASPRLEIAIYTLVIFICLMLVLSKYAWGPIIAGLDKREQRFAERLAHAEKVEAEAKVVQAQYEKKLADAHNEAREILDEARRDAEAAYKQRVAEAEAEIRSLRERSQREVETAKTQALKELAEKSADLALDLAGRLVQAHLNRADHSRLIEESLGRFPTAPGAFN